MPQVWNPSVSVDQDSGGFSKNSRFMKLSNFSDISLRRIKVRNSLENKLQSIQQAYINHVNNHSEQRFRQARKHMIERLRRHTAYKMVMKKHPIQRRVDYQAALNDNYSMHALRHELRRMLKDINPEIVRRKKAESLVKRSWDRYGEAMVHNREAIATLAPKPVAQPTSDEEEEPETRSPTPPPKPPPLRRSIVGPPLRGLAKQAQAVTLMMVKEKTWMGKPPSSSSPEKQSPVNDLNPHAVLPAIKT